MKAREALSLFAEGERIAYRAMRAGTLGNAGIRPAAGAFLRPLTAPSRYPEYAVFFDLLSSGSTDLSSPSSWVLDVGSPKLFTLMLAARSRATLVGTDIWQPAIDEAEALRGGLPPESSARLRLGTADIREPLPAALLPPDGKFAAAYSMSVIEHVEPEVGGDLIALGRIADVVRPSGCVVISVPVATRARSELSATEVYGRQPADARGAFFQRVYERTSLEALCQALSLRLRLDTCVVCEWPDHLLMRLQPRFPTAVGVVGAAFPLLAGRFVVGEPSASIPPIRRQGDAILRFVRTDG